MARTIKPLTASQIEKAKPKDKEYNLFDGEGLYLVIRPSGAKTWMLRFKDDFGRVHKLKLGIFPEMTLALAREKRMGYRRAIAEGKELDEILGKGEYAPKIDNSLELISRTWLEQYAKRKPLEEHTKHKRIRKLENHLFPLLGRYSIADIRPKDLRLALNQIYEKSADNAQRIRADLVLIFSYAVQYGYIEVNHAREMESLDLSAPKNHRPALPLQKLPELIRRIKADTGYVLTKLCLELSLHIFIRSSELRFARWSEIDLVKKQWVLPGKRTHVNGIKHSDRGAKMREPHIVPLSNQAVEILCQVKNLGGSSELVFPSSYNGAAFLSENTFNAALRRMGYDTQKEVCFHGFRAMARSALGECGLFQRDAIEKQMSHQERNDIVGAYTHVAEYLYERKRMMQWWSQYLIDIEGRGYVSPYEYVTRSSLTNTK
ncbi:tyrosine-type recombinase/integrase [Acinetobacter brisouii]